MFEKNDRDQYFFKTFKQSLVITLILLITIFYFFPRFDKISHQKSPEIPIKIYVSDIPVTRQKQSARPPAPSKPSGVIPIPAEKDVLPERIEIGGDSSALSPAFPNAGIPAEVPARPLLEVYPDVSGTSCKGFIRILLLVNKQGKVESYEILENSTGSEKCAGLAITAARKSRWIAAKVGGEPVESWVTKTYKFNVRN